MVNVGIIGTGMIAHEHATAISAIPESVALFAAADIAAERVEEFCKTYQVSHCYGSTAEILADPNIDLVAVATPPFSHEEIVIAALEAGKYVLCEKPLAQSVAGARRIEAAAARYSGRLSVSYQLRYSPQFRRMLWLVKNGWIGEIKDALVERHSYIPHVGVDDKGWWGSWAVAGGGVLVTQAIHQIDMLLAVMGNPRCIRAEMDTRFTTVEFEDWIDTSIQFENGTSARCIASVNSGRSDGSFVVTGSLGSVNLNGEIKTNDPARLTEAVRAVNRALPETVPSARTIPRRVVRKLCSKLGIERRKELTAHANLYRHIAQCIADHEPLPIEIIRGHEVS